LRQSRFRRTGGGKEIRFFLSEQGMVICGAANRQQQLWRGAARPVIWDRV